MTLQVSSQPRSDRKVAVICAGIASFMLLAAFAAVPLYDLFCRVTGFGGTPMVRSVHAQRVSERLITVRFDANVSPNLPWKFEAETPVIETRIGQTMTVNYKVTNTSDKPATGMATFNVQPAQTGAYFVKIQCFCFIEHTLQPGETLEAPVVFYIDPDVEKNKELNGLKSITLSYTYFVAKGAQPVAGLSSAEDKPKL